MLGLQAQLALKEYKEMWAQLVPQAQQAQLALKEYKEMWAQLGHKAYRAYKEYKEILAHKVRL
jgi:hypothetical protein